jgi:hypothetical protein
MRLVGEDESIVASMPPKVTELTSSRALPEIVTLVPPAAGPFAGEIPDNFDTSTTKFAVTLRLVVTLLSVRRLAVELSLQFTK